MGNLQVYDLKTLNASYLRECEKALGLKLNGCGYVGDHEERSLTQIYTLDTLKKEGNFVRDA